MRREIKSDNRADDISSIRLDLFLKQSRLIPRRSLAHQACQRGGIRVNGQVAKAGKSIRAGDLIEWSQPHKRTQLRVLRVPRSAARRKEVSALFEVIGTDWLSANQLP